MRIEGASVGAKASLAWEMKDQSVKQQNKEQKDCFKSRFVNADDQMVTLKDILLVEEDQKK